MCCVFDCVCAIYFSVAGFGSKRTEPPREEETIVNTPPPEMGARLNVCCSFVASQK